MRRITVRFILSSLFVAVTAIIAASCKLEKREPAKKKQTLAQMMSFGDSAARAAGIKKYCVEIDSLKWTSAEVIEKKAGEFVRTTIGGFFFKGGSQWVRFEGYPEALDNLKENHLYMLMMDMWKSGEKGENTWVWIYKADPVSDCLIG